MSKQSHLIHHIMDGSQLLAIVVRRDYKVEGIKFLTPGHFSQQLGFMGHPKGHVIEPHVHLEVPREVQLTKEVILIRSGRVRIDFYCQKKKYIESSILHAGDIVLLAFGGHGFEMLEESEIIEVKQGPYAGDTDKLRFNGVKIDDVVIK